MFRTEDEFTVEIALASFRSGAIDLTVKCGIVTISDKSKRRAFTRSLQRPMTSIRT